MKTFDETKEAVISIGKIIKEMPDSIQEKAFDVLLNSFLEKTHHADIKADNQTQKSDPSTTSPKPKKVQKKSGVTKETITMDKNIDLKGSGGNPSFRDFVEEKKPSSNIQFTTVAVYYLKKILQLEKVTINQVFTCYKNAGRKTPGNFAQNIWDTSSSKYGYITLNGDDIGIPNSGESFVEYDLPAKKK